MTTYELPPEPPVGSRVKDAHGTTWTRTNDGWSHPDLTSSGVTWGWGAVLNYAGPVTLIEPDPWPTAPLIVADWTSGGQQGGRGLLYRETDTDQYWTIRENESVYPEHPGDTLSNVVPVTVVPTAEWQALGEKVRGFDTARTEKQRRVVVTRAAELLIEATNALGLD